LLALIAYSREDVQLVDADTGDLVATLPAPSGTDCDFSPDGKRLAVDTLNKLAIYDIRSRRMIHLAPGHTDTINQIVYSPDGQLIATASSDRTARLWTPDGQPLSEFTGHAGPVLAVAFTPDGRSLVTGGDDGQLRFYNVATRRELINIPTGFQRIRRVSISPSGRQIALIGDDWEAGLISIPGRGEGG